MDTNFAHRTPTNCAVCADNPWDHPEEEPQDKARPLERDWWCEHRATAVRAVWVCRLKRTYWAITTCPLSQKLERKSYRCINVEQLPRVTCCIRPTANSHSCYRQQLYSYSQMVWKSGRFSMFSWTWGGGHLFWIDLHSTCTVIFWSLYCHGFTNGEHSISGVGQASGSESDLVKFQTERKERGITSYGGRAKMQHKLETGTKRLIRCVP